MADTRNNQRKAATEARKHVHTKKREGEQANMIAREYEKGKEAKKEKQWNP